MKPSNDSSEATPPFLAISSKTNEPVDIPDNIVWKTIQLDDDEMIIYIDEKGEQSFITTRPFNEEKYYRVILFDYSSVV